jgi:serine/threonine protein kinase
VYSEDEVILLMKPICDAFYKLQIVSKVANLDVKPQNMILSEKMNSFIISDFGESLVVDNKNDIIKDTFFGTPSYMSVELYNNY